MKIICLILLINFGNVIAASVDASQSAALVNVNSESSQEQALSALTSVVSKKSGLPIKSIKENGWVDESFLPIILRSYYEQVPASYAKDKMWFTVVVDEEKLRTLMLNQKIPVWPSRRGEVFVWLVEELEDESLVNASESSEAYYWLNQWLIQKGIPTKFYNYQSEDLLDFQPRDVRFLNPDLVDFIEFNYEPALSVYVFVKHSGNGFSYRYGLKKPDQPIVIKNLKFIEFSTGLDSLASDIQSAMSNDQQLFAGEFQQSTVSVKINNIVTADQILKLINYLDEHPLIDRYHINQFINGELSVMMEISVLPDTFVNFVSKEQVINHLPLDLGHSIIFSMLE